MELFVFQKGFHYAQDGCGNRLIYHLRGCNMNCPWCSNPEGMSFSKEGGVPVQEIANEAIRCKPMFFDGGGVTFTGGECTCQFEPLKEILLLLKENNIGTAIETNGTSSRLTELFPFIDELIMDCKHYNSQIHRRVTGSENGTIIENIKKAVHLHNNVLIRIPLIGGFNATEEDIIQFAELFSSIEVGSARIELLLYHEYGKEKWKQCGKTYTVTDAFVPEEKRLKYEAILREHGFNVVRT